MIYVVLGTKAQFIKMAPVIAELMKRGVPFRYISTGQHRETMEALHRNFGVREPDLRLYSGKDVTSVPAMLRWSAGVLWNVFRNKKAILHDNLKGIVLVHGDTFSTILGALMGKVLGLKVAHVESGLRSFHLFHPFPEEITRLMTFRFTDYFFCPGNWAVQNVAGYTGEKINTQLNTLYDSLRMALESELRVDVDIPKKPYAIATIHRYENIFHRERLVQVIGILETIAERIKILFILHPPTRANLMKFNLYGRLEKHPNIEFRPRYDYFEFIKLTHRSEFVVSDGGSNQEECCYMGHPCLLLRKATERVEGIGANVVVSQYRSDLVDEFLENYKSYRKSPLISRESPSQLIVDFLIQSAR